MGGKLIATGTWLYVPGFRSIINSFFFFIWQSYDVGILSQSLDEKTEAQRSHWFQSSLVGLWSLYISWPHNLSLDLCPKIIFLLHQPQNGVEDREYRSVMSDLIALPGNPGICLHRDWTESENLLCSSVQVWATWPTPWESAPFSPVGINHSFPLHFVWTSLRKVILLLNHKKPWLITCLFLCQPFCYFESYLSSKS